MRKLIIPFLAIVALIGFGTGCNSEFRTMTKKAKSTVIADKDTAAIWFYQHKKYDRAAPLLEELVPLYSGQERQQEVYYYYSWTRYLLGELVSSAYYFEDFSKKFPNNEHAEECEYMVAKCYYLLSDPYYLDQNYTDKALDQLQLFLSRNPYAKEKDKSMEMITDLRERKAKKAFEQALLYNKVGHYKSAVQAFQVMVNEFPDSKLREEAQFLLSKSAFKLAEASTEGKQLGRYIEAIDYLEGFDARFGEGDFGKEAGNLLENASKQVTQLELEAEQRQEDKLFKSFKNSVQTVLKSKDPEAREEAYASALTTYDELKDKFPDSLYLSDADKLLGEVENKQDQE